MFASVSRAGCVFLLLSLASTAFANYACEPVEPKQQLCPPPKCPPVRCEEASPMMASPNPCRPCEEDKPVIKDETTVHFVDDYVMPTKKACRSAWDRISKDKRLTIFTSLIRRFNLVALLEDPTTVATIMAPTDAAILKMCGGRYGYSKDDFMNMDPSFLVQIVENHIILNQDVMSMDVKHEVLSHLETIYTSKNHLTMQAYTGKWDYLCFATSNNFTEACAPCGNQDLTSCAAVVHVVQGLLLPAALPALPPAKGCSSVYDYISARHDMADLKAAIDVAQLQKLFNGTRTAGTYFLFTDKAAQILLTLNGYPLRRLADMSIDFITTFLSIHVIPSATIFSHQLVSGYTYETAVEDYYLLADVNAHTKVIQMWNEVSNVTITEANIAKCSAVVHILNQPLAPVGFNPIDAAPVLATYGPYKNVADLLASAPVLSGMYDLIGASALAEVAVDCKVFGTWFLPSNQALCRMARDGLTTQALFANKQRLLNMLNGHVVPFSSLPFQSLANGVDLPTAFKPVTIRVVKYRQVVGGEFKGGDVEINIFSAVDKTGDVAQVNFNAVDLNCGKAIANIIEDALLSKQVLTGRR